MAIHNARNSETDDSFGDLRLGPVERDKIFNLLPLFLKFIATLPTKSGNVVYSLLPYVHFIDLFRSSYSMFLWFCQKVLQEIC